MMDVAEMDLLEAVSRSLTRIADSIKSGEGVVEVAGGAYVGSATEALIHVGDGLFAIAEAINGFADDAARRAAAE